MKIMGNKKNSTNPAARIFGSQKMVMLVVLIALFVMFSVLSPTFRSYSTILQIFSYSYYITFMAIGATFALITGGVDLSLGTGMICYAVIGGYFIVEKGCPVIVGILITILIATAFGFFNGILVGVLNIPPFIATLGTMMITRGLGAMVTSGMSVTWPMSGMEGGWFRNIFKIKINNTMIPLGFLWVVIIVVIMTFILFHTKFGRYVIAIGSNKEATRLSGVKVVNYHVAAYTLCGFFTGLAAISYAATFQQIVPATGAGLELDAIGSAIIGGTSMNGGAGSITGTLIGVFIMSLLKTGLPFVGLQANWQQIITGIILILAVSMDVIKRYRDSRK